MKHLSLRPIALPRSPLCPQATPDASRYRKELSVLFAASHRLSKSPRIGQQRRKRPTSNAAVSCAAKVTKPLGARASSPVKTLLVADATTWLLLASEPRDLLTLHSKAGHQSLLPKDGAARTNGPAFLPAIGPRSNSL
jgi:hypothetical protein